MRNELFDPRDNRNTNEKKTKKTGAMKKSVTFGLCAILAGAIAVGGYGGISTLSQSTASNVLAATEDSNTELIFAAKSDEETEEDTEETGTKNVGSLDVSDIAESAMSSIVSINTVSVQEVENYYSSFGFGGYAPSYEQEVSGSGSGIIAGNNGTELLIVTNYHVVEDADTISVTFADNEAYDAKVKGYDEDKDLAVVAVQLDDISDDTLSAINVAEFGDSDSIKVGEQVVAIGNAMGYGQSVTTGIVSAKNRVMDSDAGTLSDASEADGVNLIQTDAAINPGNSGGALLNMDGEVIGINSAKLASTEVEGMGYAIAISDVKDILNELMNEETRDKLEDDEHGVLGIMGATVNSDSQEMYGIPAGVFVSEVTAGGAAEEAGIPARSIITKFGSKSVDSIEELISYLSYYAPGEEVEITYMVSDNGEYVEKKTTVTLAENADTEDEQENSAEEEDNDGRSRDDIFEDWGNGLFGDR